MGQLAMQTRMFATAEPCEPEFEPAQVDWDDPRPVQHIVLFSGGVDSWATGKRVADKYGVDNVVLLCSDTGLEAPDWLEFVNRAAADIGSRLVMIRNTRSPGIWERAYQKRIMPSVMSGWCVQEFKIKPYERWVKQHFPDEKYQTIHYYGFDWTEKHRLVKIQKRNPGKIIEAPLMWEPILGRQETMGMLQASGLKLPMAYDLGLSHNNCLSNGCFKQGAAAWEQLLRLMPEVYAETERREIEFLNFMAWAGFPRPHRIVKLTGPDGKKISVTLREFRESIEAQGTFAALGEDAEDFGACGCFLDDVDEAMYMSDAA